MEKIIYFIMTSHKFKHRQKNVLETWGADVDLYFYSDTEDSENKTIKVTDKSDYWSLEEKHINIFKYLENNFLDEEWFFFCDDDTFVNTKKMNEFLSSCEKDCVYGYLINCWPVMKDLFYHSGGAGVLIHRKMLNILSKNIEHKNTRFADVTLSLNLIDNKIKLLNDSKFHSEPPSYYNIPNDEIKENITFHHIDKFEDMKNLFDYTK
jgi:hypothetical protein